MEEADRTKAGGPPSGPRRHARGEDEVEFARVVAFTDGVFAIAITLLVLGLDVPSHAGDLTEALFDQRQSLFAYALSFAVLGKLWVSHHSFFGGLHSFDRTLIVLNLAYLAWIALVPFTSELLGNYVDKAPSVIVYAASVVGVTVTFGAQIAYAYRRGLLKPEYRHVARTANAPGLFSVAIVFSASVAVALVSPTAAIVMWLATAVIGNRLGELIAGPAMGR
jgi:TMEM175 potassium channel family protein